MTGKKVDSKQEEVVETVDTPTVTSMEEVRAHVDSILNLIAKDWDMTIVETEGEPSVVLENELKGHVHQFDNWKDADLDAVKEVITFFNKQVTEKEQTTKEKQKQTRKKKKSGGDEIPWAEDAAGMTNPSGIMLSDAGISAFVKGEIRATAEQIASTRMNMGNTNRMKIDGFLSVMTYDALCDIRDLLKVIAEK